MNIELETLYKEKDFHNSKVLKKSIQILEPTHHVNFDNKIHIQNQYNAQINLKLKLQML